MKRAFTIVAFGTALLALICYDLVRRGQIAQQRSMQERRERIVREVDPQGQTGIYDGELVEMLLADPVGKQITSATMISADLSHPGFQRLGEFKRLNDVGFYSCTEFERVLSVLGKLEQVEDLFIETTSFPDETIAVFAGIPALKKLHFEQIVSKELMDEFRSMRPDVELNHH